MYLIFLFISGKFKHYGNSKIVSFYFLISIFAFFFLWANWYFSNSEIYFDNVILFIKTMIVYLLWMQLKESHRGKWIIFSIFISSVFGLFYFHHGLLGTDRLNISGFEITSSAYIISAIILLAFQYLKLPQRILIFLVTFYTLFLTGSRLPFIFLLLVLGFASLNNKRIHNIILIPVVILMIVLSSFIVIHSRGDFNNVSLSLIIEKLFDTFKLFENSSPEQRIFFATQDVIAGRGTALISGIYLIKDNFPYPLASDWMIQQELLQIGFPSHTHSAFIQFILKYGILAIAFFVVLINAIVYQFKNNLKTRWAFLFLLFSFLFDYIFYVPSALALLLVLSSTRKITD